LADVTARSPIATGPTSTRRWLALAVLCVSLLIVTLDNTILNVALPTLVRDLSATTTELQWIVDGYILVFAGLLLAAGSLADRVGRKGTFLVGVTLFAAGSAWAAFSGSVDVLIAARASMGIGGALIMPSTLAIITDMFRESSERQRAIGLWAATSGVGIALGPLIGGLLLDHFWWGSVFLLNVPVAAAGICFAIPLVPDSRNEQAKRPDVVGAAMSVAGLGLLVWAIIEAPTRTWTSARVLAAGCAGLLVLAAFVWWERRSTHPMLELGFFRRRAFSGAVSSVAFVMFGLFSTLFLLTQYLQFVLGYTPFGAGLRALPAAGAIAVVAPLSALLIATVGTRITMTVGLCVISGGLWQLSTTTAGSSYGDLVPGLILLGVGAGMAIPSATGSVMGSLPQQHTGVGGGTNGAFLQVGGALGVAVIGSLLTTRYQDRMSGVLPAGVPRATRDAILGSIGGAQQVAAQVGGAAGQALNQAAKAAFVNGMSLGLTVAAPVAAAAALIAFVVLPARRRQVTSVPPAGEAPREAA
jgi:EmrB/QacA subfamily drug resistance transporter